MRSGPGQQKSIDAIDPELVPVTPTVRASFTLT